ncbi:hypothetical protein D3C73_670280 [compost metagenome]
MLRHRCQPLLAAGDVGDLHQVVVDDVCHVIGRHAVALDEHLHVNRIPRDRDVAINAVGKVAGSLGRDFHAHDGAFAGGHLRSDFFRSQMQAETVVFRWLAGGALAFAHLLKPLGRAEAAEGMALVEQVLCERLVHVLALGLAVRTVGAADIRAFRPFQARPFQRIQNPLLEFERRAGGIGILDAQDELAAILLGKEVVEKGDIGGADMRLAGGRGSDADAWGRVDHCAALIRGATGCAKPVPGIGIGAGLGHIQAEASRFLGM